jgi:hypothetical protein
MTVVGIRCFKMSLKRIWLELLPLVLYPFHFCILHWSVWLLIQMTSEVMCSIILLAARLSQKLLFTCTHSHTHTKSSSHTQTHFSVFIRINKNPCFNRSCFCTHCHRSRRCCCRSCCTATAWRWSSRSSTATTSGHT